MTSILCRERDRERVWKRKRIGQNVYVFGSPISQKLNRRPSLSLSEISSPDLRLFSVLRASNARAWLLSLSISLSLIRPLLFRILFEFPPSLSFSFFLSLFLISLCFSNISTYISLYLSLSISSFSVSFSISISVFLFSNLLPYSISLSLFLNISSLSQYLFL